MKFTNISENELKTISGGRLVVDQTPQEKFLAFIQKLIAAIEAKYCSTGSGGGVAY